MILTQKRAAFEQKHVSEVDFILIDTQWNTVVY